LPECSLYGPSTSRRVQWSSTWRKSMGPTTINDLPAHVLLVHIVVVFVPLAAILLVCSAVWPAARRRPGLITPVVSLRALVSVPLPTRAGSWLIRRVQPDPLVRAHAQLGDEMLPWAGG